MVKKMVKPGSLSVVIPGLIVLLSLDVVAPKQLSAAENTLLNNNVYIVEKIQDRTGIAISGKVIAFKEITFTAQMPGRIEFIAGEEGSWFPAGQVVLAQNDRILVAQRNAAVSQIRSAQTALQNSQVQYNREMLSPMSSSQQPMPGMGFPAMFDQFVSRGSNSGLQRQADIYSRYSGISQAQASYQQAYSELRTIDEKLRDTQVITPFEGVITKKMVEVGDTVQPGQALFTFAHTRYFRVQAEVPARLVTLLHTGLIVNAYLDNDQRVIPVRVANIYPAANNNNHTVTVKFDLPTGIPVATGMYVRLQLPDNNNQNRQLLVIPNSALISGSSLPGVMLLTENNKTELRVLRLGHELQNGRVVVLAGLKPGDRIINNFPNVSKTSWSSK
ncbi:MAG: efflux RND transporter periplasmic adaptor subunit [Thiohalomonadales bacterium]